MVSHVESKKKPVKHTPKQTQVHRLDWWISEISSGQMGEGAKVLLPVIEQVDHGGVMHSL